MIEYQNGRQNLLQFETDLSLLDKEVDVLTVSGSVSIVCSCCSFSDKTYMTIYALHHLLLDDFHSEVSFFHPRILGGGHHNYDTCYTFKVKDNYGNYFIRLTENPSHLFCSKKRYLISPCEMIQKLSPKLQKEKDFSSSFEYKKNYKR